MVTAAAEKHLAPIGVTRKGRSRSWVDDHGWWLGIVEFQPPSSSKGSYLNVGVMWLWNVADHLVFDIFLRIGQYVPYVSDSQFAPETDRLAQLALAQLTEWRRSFPSVAETAAVLSASTLSTANDCLNAGMANGLAGNRDGALPLLNRYVANEDRREWAIRKRAEVEAIANKPDADSLRLAIEDRVRSSRDALRLPFTGDHSRN
jgi:hypothetical protein